MDSIKLGIEGYLLKPIRMDQFLQALSKCIENLNLKKENLAYKNSLEQKVHLQVEELMHKDKLLIQQSKMAAMGEMIDAIAHQWKQPLNAIALKSEFISALANEDGAIDKEHIDKCRTDIKKQIDHLIDTIDEFRKFFRPNNNITPININSLLNTITLLLKDELIKHTVSVNILCDETIVINANENEIKHLFINLVNNAKDEMVKSGIKNEERIIAIECSEKNEEVMFSVKDNGRGIPENVIEEIFKPHFTTKQDDGG
ncbi:MAG: hybrid sensor histidine kinase/response regulator, partial [Campylobacterota bacterium]|nr:hybrid sensor histidine kinase/response regulator [Campylobacterota bacterium]